MKDAIMPLNCIRQWQFRKYKSGLIPILIILVGFTLQLSGIKIPFNSIIMSLSLVAYLAVLFVYRIGNPTIPGQDNIIVSPVHGKVLSVEQVNDMVKIRIHKSMFDPIELRCPIFLPGKVDDSELIIPYGKHEIHMSFDNKIPFLFHEHGTVLGSLLGLLRGSYHVTLRFNESVLAHALQIKKGDIVKAGETILAELKEQIV
jgi:hypothetical protein